jgi:hypothetical protein
MKKLTINGFEVKLYPKIYPNLCEKEDAWVEEQIVSTMKRLTVPMTLKGLYTGAKAVEEELAGS